MSTSPASLEEFTSEQAPRSRAFIRRWLLEPRWWTDREVPTHKLIEWAVREGGWVAHLPNGDRILHTPYPLATDFVEGIWPSTALNYAEWLIARRDREEIKP